MNKSVATVTTALLITALSSAGLVTVSKAYADTPEDIMKESHLTYYYAADDGASEVEMTLTSKKGKTRVRKFTMLRKDFTEGGEQRYFTYFKEPGDVRRMTFMV